MATTNYAIRQIVYTGMEHCLTNIGINATDVTGAQQQGGNWGQQKAPYQQILLKPTDTNFTFEVNNKKPVSYYLHLDIPRNQVYDLNFALLLLDSNTPVSGGDLDQYQYQFIRYLHVPKIANEKTNSSKVLLYAKRIKDSEKKIVWGEPQSTIVKPMPDDGSYIDYGINGFPTSSDYNNNDDIIYYRYIKDLATYNYYYKISGNYYQAGCYIDDNFYPIGTNIVELTHSWETVDNNGQLSENFDIIFTPRVNNSNGWKYLYLYLIPTADDNDIQWVNAHDNKSYYGRHIDDINTLNIGLYKMSNLLENNQINEAINLGLWGHSELLFMINGEELRVGPSGYYEVQNFPVTTFGVAAMDNKDQFTCDLQIIS